MQCPNCGTENQTGKYCAECGASMGGTCPSCGAAPPPGTSYCTACGESLTGGHGAGGASKAPWLIATVAVLTVLLVLYFTRDTEQVMAPRAPVGAPMVQPGQAGGGAMGGGAMGGLSSDMRTNADRLFNRIMVAAEQGNRAEVDQFMPMAVQAYGMVQNLDDDGLYHLALLHLAAGDPAAARGAADRILQSSPSHILALGVAAAAAVAGGDQAEARSLWQRLLDGYAAESDRLLTEYRDHETMLAEYRQQAERGLAGG